MQIHKSAYTVKHIWYHCSHQLMYNCCFICLLHSHSWRDLWDVYLLRGDFFSSNFLSFLSLLPIFFLYKEQVTLFFRSTIFAIKTWPIMLTSSWRTNYILFRWEVINNGPYYELMLKNCSNINENEYRSLKREVDTVLFILSTKIMV